MKIIVKMFSSIDVKPPGRRSHRRFTGISTEVPGFNAIIPEAVPRLSLSEPQSCSVTGTASRPSDSQTVSPAAFSGNFP